MPIEARQKTNQLPVGHQQNAFGDYLPFIFSTNPISLISFGEKLHNDFHVSVVIDLLTENEKPYSFTTLTLLLPLSSTK